MNLNRKYEVENKVKSTNDSVNVLFTIFKYYCSVNNQLNLSNGILLSRQSFSGLIKQFKLCDVYNASLSDFINCFNDFAVENKHSTDNINFIQWIKFFIGISYIKYSKFNYSNFDKSKSSITFKNLHLKISSILNMNNYYPGILEQCVSTLINKHIKPNNYRTIVEEVDKQNLYFANIQEKINTEVENNKNLLMFLTLISKILEKIYLHYARKIHKSQIENKSNKTCTSDYYLSYQDFVKFLSDFKIFPNLMTIQKQFFQIFSSLVFRFDEYVKYSNKEFFITFENFIMSILMIAFSAPLLSLNSLFFNKLFILLERLDINGFNSLGLSTLKNELNSIMNKFSKIVDSSIKRTKLNEEISKKI